MAALTSVLGDRSNSRTRQPLKGEDQASSILYIINPAGYGGTGIKVWERVQSESSEEIDAEDVRFTERQGHAREIAASAEGYDILAAVGGDGTVGEIMSGIMAQPPPHPRLAIIPAGTGNE